MFESFTAYSIFYFILTAIFFITLFNEKKLLAIEYKLRKKYRAYRKAKRIEKYKKEAQAKKAAYRSNAARSYNRNSGKSYAA